MKSLVAVVVVVALLAGCATSPRVPEPERAQVPAASVGATIALAAESQIGRPYRYGGAAPDGFDCSGLVLFAHSRAGFAVPRTTADQHRAARAISRADLRPGDLVFFRVSGAKPDHVGIFTGDGRFVHAPSTGRVVSVAYLDDPWFARRFIGAGRLWKAGEATAAETRAP